jgi:branched-chain amino acid transport system permease protein
MFTQQLFNGLMLGGFIALLAVGFSLLFSILRIINFSHGSVFMVGAYVTTILVDDLKVPFLLAMLGGMVAAGLLDVVVERVAVAPLRTRGLPRWYGMITTFAMALIIENLAYRVFGTTYRVFPSPIEVQSYTVLGATVTNLQVLTLASAIVLMILLVVFVRFTWIGRAFRAVAQDADTASLMGVNANLVVPLAFFVSGCLAGAAGTLVGMYRNLVAVNMGLGVGLKGFVSSVLGGVGSIPGAALGGFILGVAEALTAAYVSANVKGIVAFIVLIIVLTWRPTGILGRETL